MNFDVIYNRYLPSGRITVNGQRPLCNTFRLSEWNKAFLYPSWHKVPSIRISSVKFSVTKHNRERCSISRGAKASQDAKKL